MFHATQTSNIEARECYLCSTPINVGDLIEEAVLHGEDVELCSECTEIRSKCQNPLIHIDKGVYAIYCWGENWKYRVCICRDWDTPRFSINGVDIDLEKAYRMYSPDDYNRIRNTDELHSTIIAFVATEILLHPISIDTIYLTTEEREAKRNA